MTVDLEHLNQIAWRRMTNLRSVSSEDLIVLDTNENTVARMIGDQIYLNADYLDTVLPDFGEEPDEDDEEPSPGRKVEAGTPEAEGESVADEIDPEEAIENVARTSALAAGDRVKDASIRAVQSASIGGVLETAAVAGVVAGAVRALSPGADLVQAQRDTNTIFGLGRIQEGRTQGAEKGIRSAMLESATCEVCLSKDGAEFPIEDLDEWACPDPGCLGGDQCNCITIFLPKES